MTLYLKYGDLRTLDTVVWAPKLGRLERALSRRAGVSEHSEAAVFLGNVAPGVGAWFVTGDRPRVCSLSLVEKSAESAYVVRPRGPARSNAQVSTVVQRALSTVAECRPLLKYSGQLGWVTLSRKKMADKVAQVLGLWVLGFPLCADAGRDVDDFGRFAEIGIAEVVSVSEDD